jgi:putative ABC transport system permease protein
VTIAGVFADYGNERGSLVVAARQFTDWFATEHAASVILKLRDPADAERLRAELLAAHPGLQAFTNAHLRAEVLRIFRQTFALTYALEAIGLAVAVLGLAMTLASVLLERRGELATLRALGLTRGELARAAAGEGLLLALAGLAVGLAASLVLGWLLIRVINKQTFGWTLEFALPAGQLALLAGLVVATALAVSHAVGRWGARLPAEREE